MIIEGAGASFSLVFPPFVISSIISLLIGIMLAMVSGTSIDKRWWRYCGRAKREYSRVCAREQYFLAYKLGWFPIKWL